MKRLVFSILLILLVGVGCAPGGASCIPSIPAVNSFEASPSSISAGQSSTLSWKVAGATMVNIDQGIGNVALTGSREVMPSATTVYTLTATNALGVGTTATAQVIVSGTPSPPTPPSPPAGLPVVNSFTANPPSITAGNWATLSWNVSNATSVTIDQGIGAVVSSGNTSVSPVATTTYTLTATNAAGSTPAMTQVIVSGAPPAAGLPVVNYFTASPPVISAGSSTILGWSVSNATSVTIDHGVGAVGSVGTTTVSPPTSTNYTLTASNASGWYSLTISVLVSGAPPPPAGTPDLVITSINRVETAEGYKINYTIKNQGTVAAGASTAKLYANDVYKASDSVGSLAAGASETKQFTGWVFNPTMPHIKVVADANTAVIESDETNNEKLVNYAIQIRYDFVDNAGAASILWRSGLPATNLSFGGGGGTDGSASYQSVTMEDGTSYGKVLATHPKWVDDGYIYGYYPISHLVKPGDHFVGRVGIIKGGSAGNVRFEVTYREVGSIAPETLLVSQVDTYDGNLKTIDVTLPSGSFGKQLNFYLRVRANGSSAQDWAAWVEARLIR